MVNNLPIRFAIKILNKIDIFDRKFNYSLMRKKSKYFSSIIYLNTNRLHLYTKLFIERRLIRSGNDDNYSDILTLTH